MASETEVTVRGRLGANPELQVSESKKAWLRLRVATSRRIRVGDAWEDGPASWYDVKMWDDFARNAAESLHKGDAVIVQGELRIEEYTNASGITFRSPVIHAHAIGPDLRAATARITRVARTAPGNEPGGPGADVPVDLSQMQEVPDVESPAPWEVVPDAPATAEEIDDEVVRFVAQL